MNKHHFLEVLSWIAGIAVAMLTFYLWFTHPGKEQIPSLLDREQIPTATAGITSGPERLLQPVSPSFECSKARWKSERLVCSSQELAVLDLAMSNAYRDAVAHYPYEKHELRNAQNYWLRNIRESCNSVLCLKGLYETRIAELKNINR